MSETIDGEEHLNKKEIQKLTGWSYQTVEKYLQAHKFPHWRIPGKSKGKYYRKSDIEKMQQPQQAS